MQLKVLNNNKNDMNFSASHEKEHKNIQT